jgi:hypothetical protein
MSKRVKPVAKVAGTPTNMYLSVCCKALANKPACAMPKGKGIGSYLGAKTEGDATLGTWRCSTCHKKCKVTVQPRPAQEKLTV